MVEGESFLKMACVCVSEVEEGHSEWGLSFSF